MLLDVTGETGDVAEERKRIESIPLEGDDDHSIIIRGMHKVFPGIKGGPEKVCGCNLLCDRRKSA